MLYKKIRRLVWRKFFRSIFLKWHNPQRYIVEKIIFPQIKNKRVLMVGCADYTDFYPSLLGKYGNEVYSLDIDPSVAQYGAIKHTTGNAVYLRKYYPKEFFDVVLFGGVFGYGLNKIKDAEKAMKALHVVLKKKGKLVIWWADQKGNNSVVPKKLKNFKLFKRIDLISLYSGYRTKSKVVFDILEKQ